MTSDTLITKKGKEIALYRMYTQNAALSSTEYAPASQFQVGIDSITPTLTITELVRPIPIADGIVNDDGSNQLTGSNGGSNTTDNITTYKQGANTTDATAQNLIATTGNATKTWTISDLATDGIVIDKTKFMSIWLYIIDQAALDKIVDVEVRLGSAAGNYFSKTWLNADLQVGWNWLDSEETEVEDLTETGTVGATINYFQIEITTDDADDEFAAGDVIYDLLRTWAKIDTRRDFVVGTPTLNFTNNEAITRLRLPVTFANGFLIDGVITENKDTIPLATSAATIEPESKSNTDEFIFVMKDRLL